MTLAPDDPRHGTIGAYTNHKCRCDLCRETYAEYNRKYRAEHPEVRVQTMLRGRRLRAARRTAKETP